MYQGFVLLHLAHNLLQREEKSSNANIVQFVQLRQIPGRHRNSVTILLRIVRFFLRPSPELTLILNAV